MKAFRNQKSAFRLVLIALIGIALCSCDKFGNGGKNDPEFRLSDLQALWQNTNKKTHYVRFTNEASDEAKYFLGRDWDDSEWDDPDMTFEEFLIWNRQQLGHPGNGWFKYWFESTGGLHELHFMDNEGAEIPKEYIVSVLTDTKLEYYEKEKKSNKFTFEKVVETKK